MFALSCFIVGYYGARLVAGRLAKSRIRWLEIFLILIVLMAGMHIVYEFRQTGVEDFDYWLYRIFIVGSHKNSLLIGIISFSSGIIVFKSRKFLVETLMNILHHKDSPPPQSK